MKYIFIIISIFATIILSFFSPFKKLDNFFYDLSIIVSLPYKAPYEVAIVAIDEESLRFIGRWPWRRDVLAEVIKNILNSKPKVLCIDIGFFENTPKDDFLQNSLRSDIPIVLPVMVSHEKNPKILKPPEYFLLPNVYLGHLHILLENDGIVRKIPSSIKYEGKTYPSFSYIPEEILKGKEEMPKEIGIFYQYPEPFYIISALKLLQREEEVLKDKVVFFGGTSSGLWDSFLTPISSNNLTPGVFIQAHSFRTISSNKIIKDLKLFFKSIFFVGFILIFILISRKISPYLSILIVIFIIFIMGWIFLQFCFWTSPFFSFLSVLIFQILELANQIAKSRIVLKEERRKLLEILKTLPVLKEKKDEKTKSILEEIKKTKETIEDLKYAFLSILNELSLVFYYINEEGEIVYINKNEWKFPSSGPFFPQISFLFNVPSEELQKEETTALQTKEKAYLYRYNKLKKGGFAIFFDITEEEEKNIMINSLLHDLKTPITILDGIGSNLNEEVENLKKQTKRMKDLLSQYEILMKLRSKKYILQKANLNIYSFLKNIISEIEPIAKKKNIKIKLNRNNDLFIKTDEFLLYRIVLNILSNSLKFTPKDGEIEVNYFFDGNFILTIEDSGPGIKEEEYDLIIKPFYGNKEREGLGIGISFVRSALKILNGKIAFGKSKLGGLKVEINLPQ